MPLNPNFWTTHVGSVPYLDVKQICETLVTRIDMPAWPQFPRRKFRENMYVQFSPALPALKFDESDEKIYFITTGGDFNSFLEEFYAKYLADDFKAFGLLPENAAGFFALLDNLRQNPREWVKGQVTGPISMGLTITDQDLRASLYNELLEDVLIKNCSMNARWQIQELYSVSPNVVLFVDEPYMSSFGSAFISLSEFQVTSALNEVFTAIHSEGALAGVHCCGNTDWSVLLKTEVDILNLDAYGYIEHLALYPEDLRAFLDRDGILAWGIVPNNADIFKETPLSLSQRLLSGFDLISQKAKRRGVTIEPEEFFSHSLITHSCGLGPATIEIADRSFDMLIELGETLRNRTLSIS